MKGSRRDMSLATSQRARETPDAAALIDDRRSISWAELDDLLNRAGNALLSADLGPGGRVAVFAENAAEVLIAHSAATSVGISTVPVNFHLTATELAHILETSGTRVLFVGPETAAVGIEAAAAAHVPSVIGWRCPPTDSLTRWEEWVARSDGAEPPSDMPPRPYLYFTSGTTGLPKGTEAPPANFPGGATVAEYFAKLRQAQPEPSAQPALVVTPCYHNSAIRTLRDLATGTPVVVLGRFDAERTLAAIDRYRVESVVMVPTHFQRLLALPEEVRARYDMSSLQTVVHTGAACPVDVKRRMIDWWGPILVEVYGATESGTTNMITSREWLEHPGSIGRTVAQFELQVIGEDGEQLGPGRAGRLYFRDTTGRGIVYHNDPDKTLAAHRAPGVFTLGEIGYADEDGYVYITDRSSDMVVSGGVNLYPAESEKVLAAHPGVADVAVIGVPNADMGEELKALIVAADPARPPAAAELDAFCRERLSRYKCPRSYEVVPDLGRTTMGKINKRVLRAPYWPTARTIGG
ncbi:putative fatty-acid--CoA ligase [Nocardia nova SH22a]|uniref:Putative fatty-acid--CoA ligase n=2 Tax=Nocardia nova TaxID=37330 RepID=W5TGT6_9NOCA|nr:putative fatty-acid--CoA ligase [Nocardia nova SH22a]